MSRGKSQEKNKEIIRIHFDTEKSMPKEKENDRNFFLDKRVWLGYNGLMNGGEIAPSRSTFGISH